MGQQPKQLLGTHKTLMNCCYGLLMVSTAQTGSRDSEIINERL